MRPIETLLGASDTFTRKLRSNPTLAEADLGSDTLPGWTNLSDRLTVSSISSFTDVQEQIALCINLTKLCQHTVATVLDGYASGGEDSNLSQLFVLEGRISNFLFPLADLFLRLREQCTDEDLRVVIEEHHHHLTNMMAGLRFIMEEAVMNPEKEFLIPERVQLIQRYLAFIQEEYELNPWKEMPHFISTMLKCDFEFHNVEYEIQALNSAATIGELDCTFIGLNRIRTLRILGEICVFNPKKFTDPTKQPQVNMSVHALSGSILRLEVLSNSIPYRLGVWDPSQERNAAPAGTTETGSGLQLIDYLLRKHGYTLSSRATEEHGNILTIELVDKHLRDSLLPPEVRRVTAVTVAEYLGTLTTTEIIYLAALLPSTDAAVRYFVDNLSDQDIQSQLSARCALEILLKSRFADKEAVDSALSFYRSGLKAGVDS